MRLAAICLAVLPVAVCGAGARGESAVATALMASVPTAWDVVAGDDIPALRPRARLSQRDDIAVSQARTAVVVPDYGHAGDTVEPGGSQLVSVTVTPPPATSAQRTRSIAPARAPTAAPPAKTRGFLVPFQTGVFQ